MVIDLEVNACEFALSRPLDNFLNLNFANHLGKIRLSEFSFLALKSDSVAIDEFINIEEEALPYMVSPIQSDPTASISLNNINVGNLNFQEGEGIYVDRVQEDSNQILLRLSNFGNDIQLIPISELANVKLRNCEVQFSDSVVQSRTLKARIDGQNEMVISPLNNSLTIRVDLPAGLLLSEDYPINISQISFLEHRPNRQRKSSVLSGNLRIEETNESYQLRKNVGLNVIPTDLQINSFEISGKKIKLELVGQVEKITIGDSERNILPTWLEYLNSNNYLLVLLNSYLVIITFVITIVKLRDD